ncbi:hypothetical protein [Bacteroides sp.]|uniref:hypothetical protein n=1 Tax=Bacteroides sp. TaxID=29523 RepID=UPI002607F596|nr:hypothetical protein [Bacteroides sp.]MDD3039071.1 hypothetical protein [Bacteroides sp.]
MKKDGVQKWRWDWYGWDWFEVPVCNNEITLECGYCKAKTKKVCTMKQAKR